jgi:selenocysteine-specific elongation factor
VTGTVIEGAVGVGDEIEFPNLNLIKKVKSIQMFKKPVEKAY